jgi:transcriptional regulator GlxA family with amidase domain
LPTAERNALVFKLGRIARQKDCTTFSDEQLEDALALLVLRELNAVTGRRFTLNAGSCWAVVHEVVDYIHANYAEPMTLTKLCQLVNVSERTLRYHFLKTTGLNPQQYLSNYRLHRAHALLVENRVAEVADAARACGIPHTGRFSQYFKAMFGESPSRVLRRPAQVYRQPKAL